MIVAVETIRNELLKNDPVIASPSPAISNAEGISTPLTTTVASHRPESEAASRAVHAAPPTAPTSSAATTQVTRAISEDVISLSPTLANGGEALEARGSGTRTQDDATNQHFLAQEAKASADSKYVVSSASRLTPIWAIISYGPSRTPGASAMTLMGSEIGGRLDYRGFQRRAAFADRSL